MGWFANVTAALLDINGDGCLDLLGAWGRCDGTFERHAAAGFESHAAADKKARDVRWADFTGDGIVDAFTNVYARADDDTVKAGLLVGHGDGTFHEDAGVAALGIRGFGETILAADFDNDGDLDLFLTTVYATASFKKPNFPVLFRNDGAKSDAKWVFADATAGSGLESLPPTYQAAWADVNRDGRLDLVTAGRLFMNEGSDDAHWLGLRLRGDGFRVNRDAIGAQVRVTLPDGRTLSRQVEAGTGEGNANSPILHFGLGACAGPLEVEVRWPNGERLNARLDGVNRIVELAQQLPAP
jgi:hypothetical protein